MLRLLLTVALLSSFGFAKEYKLKETPYKIASSYIGQGKPVMLDVGGEMCKSCQEMAKLMYEIKKRFPDAHLFYVNIDADRDMLKKLRIVAIPTQIIYDKNGYEVYRHLGSMTYEELVTMLQDYHFDNN